MKFLLNAKFWLAGPLVFLLAVAVMLGMATWMPAGVASVNNLIIPMLAFPLIWSALFFFAYLTASNVKVFAVLVAIAIVHAAIFYLHFTA